MDTSIISIIALIVGLMLLWAAIRAFMNASIIAGIIWLLLGLWLLELDYSLGLFEEPLTLALSRWARD
jgi:uncharacterized membrane protein